MPAGLPNLDLAAPGDPCQHSQMCRMTCLVCGKSMADGDEPEFEQLVELLDDFSSRIQEHKEQVTTMRGMDMLADTLARELKKGRNKALRRYNLAWIDRWERPVHKHCAKETPCQCMVPVCADMCAVHKKRLPPTRAKRAQPQSQSRMQAPAHPCTSKPAQQTVAIVPATDKVSVTFTKASWLQKPTEIASTSSSYRAAPAPAATWSQNKKRKPVPPKPNLRLQAAAATCQKMESFTRRAGRPDYSKQQATEEEDGEYDLEWHEANFDPWKHGDFWKGGQMWFRRPDGKVIPSFEGVRKFTRSGYLVPG